MSVRTAKARPTYEVFRGLRHILTIPYSYTKKIQHATKEQLLNYRIIGGGVGVHFEEIDEDISLSGIITYKINHELKAS